MKTRIQSFRLAFILALLAVVGLSAAGNFFVPRSTAAAAPLACTYTVSPLTKTVGPAATTFQVNVDVSSVGCAWTATTPATWLHISPAAGILDTIVTISVDANHTPQRLDNITIAGKVLTVTQTGGCSFGLNPTSNNVGAAGGNFVVGLSASSALCDWTASENSPWLVLGKLNGTGAASISYAVFSNDGPARTATFTAGGQTFTVNQASGCTFTATPNDFNFTEAGGGSTVNMQPSNAACTFNANALVPWVHIGNNANGKFNFTVDANVGPARDGLISAGFNSIAIHQRSGCGYTLTPNAGSLPNIAGNGTFTVVTTSSMCQWQASSSAAWLKPGNTQQHTGSGNLPFTWDANPGAQRTAFISVGGEKFTVTQAEGCSVSVNQNSQSFAASGGSGSVAVTASGSDCPYTAFSNDSWITVGGGPGVQKYLGSINVPILVAANNGPARTGTITVAGKNIIIGQASGCTFTLTPNAQNFTAAGGDGVVNVTASNAACAYSTSNVPAWITVTNKPNGAGSGLFTYTVAANNGAARNAVITIAGLALTITQEAVPAKPAPAIAALSPGFTAMGGKDFTLKVTGANFNANCRVRWNGQERATTFVGNGELQAAIPATDLQTEGATPVTVFDQSASALSNEKMFMIYGPLANVSAASFNGETLAPASIIAAFGLEMATQTMAANKLPLPVDLAGTVVTVQDSLGQTHQAPLFFVSNQQVNYLMPEKVALGPALVMIQSGNKHISVQYVQIAAVAPALFTANANGKGVTTGLVLRVKANNQQVYEPLAQLDPQTNKFVARPIDVAEPGETVYLIFYGTGIRNRGTLDAVQIDAGGVQLKTDFAGKVGGLEGLDQLNVIASPALAGRGEVDVQLRVDGKLANVVRLAFK